MRLTIKNKTDYPTPVLRKIIKAAAKQVGVKKDKTVQIVYARHRGCITGWGWYGDRVTESHMRTNYHRGGQYTCHVLIRLPKPKYNKKTPNELALSLGAVAAHEFMHNLGVEHKDMTRDQYHCRTAWAERWGTLNDVELKVD